jgi:hypothetical protein
MEELMPTESLIVVGAVLGAFAFFTIAVVFVDMTWRGASK